MADVRIEGLAEALAVFRGLPPELLSKRNNLMRSALRRAAKPILDEARRNVQRIIDAPNIDGEFVSTGLAKKSIRIKSARPLDGAAGSAVIIAVRSIPYPNRTIQRKTRGGGKGKTRSLRTNDVLFMLEHGTERRRPMPWMRPAFEAKRSEVLQKLPADLLHIIQRALQKLDKRP